MFRHFLFAFGISFMFLAPGVAQTPESLCNPPILSRLSKHTIKAGETLETIANQYNIVPDTLIINNPNLTGDTLPVGTEIIIPPINGMIVNVPPNATWQDVAEAYGIRPDLLFEVNGCGEITKQVFVPGVTWQFPDNNFLNNYTGLSGYPLPEKTTVGLAYGWQNEPSQAQRLFHSGVDLFADVGTPVLAVEPGLVVFVGQQGNYGQLIVISHQGGLQTRYAHLQSMSVIPGQNVNTGDVIGTVGTSGIPDLDVPHLHFEVRYQTTMGWLAQDPLIHLGG